MPKNSILNDQWWRLLFLALTSFSVPIFIASLSSFQGIEDSPCPSTDVADRDESKEEEEKEETEEKEEKHEEEETHPISPKKILPNTNTPLSSPNTTPQCKLSTVSHSPTASPDSTPTLTRQFRGLEKSYSIEDSSSDNGTVDLPENRFTRSFDTIGLQQPFVIAMVGLPARGKSHIVKMMIRYLRWTGFEAQVFNVGSYRRQVGGLAGMSSDFFSSENTDATQLREAMAREVQDIMYRWLHIEEASKKGRVAIFDATNTTVKRRQELCIRARQEQVGLLFVESICDDVKILEANYNSKLSNDDYREMDHVTAKEDFVKRVQAYEAVYQTIDDAEDAQHISYIKLINVGQKVISRHCYGYLPSQVAFYLQNVHISPRTLYLTLPAENSDSVMSIVGGDDARMTPNGRTYSLNLSRYLNMVLHEHESPDSHDEEEAARQLVVLTGTARVHAETALHLRLLHPCYSSPLLNELRGGSFHGMQRPDIKKHHRDIYDKRQADKLNFRYPGVGGESYEDVIERARPIVIELERQRKPVIIICHLAVMRCIYGYFTGTPMEDIPYLDFERHTLYSLTPGAEGCQTAALDISKELRGSQ